MQLSEMTYTEKLAMVSCIHCGSPIRLHSNKCNHCGCDYISFNTKEIEEVKVDKKDGSIISLNINQEVETNMIHYHGMSNSVPTKMSHNKIIIEYLNENKILDDMITNMHNTVGPFGKRKEQNISLKYKGYNVFVEGCLIVSTEIYHYGRDVATKAEIIFDKISYDKDELK